jgi:glycerol-3-phosphate dehydrogenase (NAD(P)+)
VASPVATIAVVGATSWGVTLAGLLSRGESVSGGSRVTLITRSREEAAAVAARRGIARLPEVAIPESVNVGPPEALEASFDGVIVVVPAQHLRATLMQLPPDCRVTPVVSAAKGMELSTGLLMHEVIADCGWAPGLVSALSGPNLAHEIARGLFAASVVASPTAAAAAQWQKWLGRPSFRVYSSTDVVGVEAGGAMKNIIAIAAGAADALELGSNTIAAIVTRGLAEITRLGVALGAEEHTFGGLAGIGDLCTTCYSPMSRNRRIGGLIAAGRTPAEARAEIGEVVEGAAPAPVARDLARRHGVELPLTETVCDVLEGKMTAREALGRLLARPLRPETQ